MVLSTISLNIPITMYNPNGVAYENIGSTPNILSSLDI
jgi:hypothetical protein